MKIRWIYTMIFIFTFLIVPVNGYGQDEQTCQPDAIVMFGNGVWNDVEDVNESMQILQGELEFRVLGTNLEGKIRYGTSYNPSASQQLGLLGILDFFETFVQDIETNHSDFWHFLLGLAIMPDILQDKLKEISSLVDSTIVSLNPSVQKHIAVYDNYLREGEVIVLVAHSQGNLYGNIAYLGIDPQYKDRFGIVSVANPDSNVAGEGPWTVVHPESYYLGIGPYTTIDEDYIIYPLPFALPNNLDNFAGPVNLADWSGHKFIESYMAIGKPAETVITDNVISMIEDLRLRNRNCGGLPDTGQWQDFTPIFGEDSDYTINPLSYTDNGDGTVTDNNTGLMWQQADDGIERTWVDAISYCSNLSLAGHTDWRLPDVHELTDIVNYGESAPAIDTTFFLNTKVFYWSSTTHAITTYRAWYVYFASGYVGIKPMYDPLNIRCVRGGQ